MMVMYDATRRNEEFDVLDKLRLSGPLPRQLEQRHQKLRREQLFKAGLVADDYPPPSTSRLENVDMTVTDWVRPKWTSADATVRRSLRAIAEALGIPLPLVRTRSIPMPRTLKSKADVPIGPPTRRTDSEQHTNHGEPAPLDSLAGMDPQSRNDPPAWHDDDAPEWEPSESLTEALHDALDPDDRGWY